MKPRFFRIFKIASLTVFSAATLLCLPVGAANAATSEIQIENQVKAAFLKRFLGYIERRADEKTIIESTASPLICIYRDPGIFEAMEELEKAGRLNEPSIAYKQITDLNELGECSLLFIGDEMKHRMPQILSQLKGSGVVTASDAANFVDNGGMIQLIKQGSHVRFILNRFTAELEGIRFGAQLLSLAKEVQDKE